MKSDALDTLETPITQEEMIEYTDVLYVDIANPDITGLTAHNQQTNLHQIPKLKSVAWDNHQKARAIYDTKLDVDDERFDAKMNVSGTEATGTLTFQGIGKQIVLDNYGVGRTIKSTSRGEDYSPLRWAFITADDSSESGDNNGSHFLIARYDDDGYFLGTPLGINRATGVVAIGRLQVGDGPIQQSVIDIRYQAERPTNDLQMGTMWLIKDELSRDYNIGESFPPPVTLMRDYNIGESTSNESLMRDYNIGSL